MWWIDKFGNVTGPYSDEQVARLVRMCQLRKLDKISKDRQNWQRVNATPFWNPTSARPEEIEVPQTPRPKLSMGGPAAIGWRGGGWARVPASGRHSARREQPRTAVTAEGPVSERLARCRCGCGRGPVGGGCHSACSRRDARGSCCVSRSFACLRVE